MTLQHDRAHRLTDALSTPASDVVPHPALDVPAPAREERPGLDRVVFGVTALLAVAFLVWGFVSTGSLASASDHALSWVMDDTGWLFVLTASAFVVFVIWLAASRFGDIRLGRDDEEPEFRTSSWVAMMFSAGMGIGLMFYGVSEPVSHLVTPPPGTGAAGGPEAVQHAMATTLFHWTLHPWAIYAVVGLAIAYGVYRKGRVQLISAAFEPLLGRHANGGWGKVIDILAIFATLFGSAASLGLGALQIRSGLQIVSGVGATGNGVIVGIISVLTVAFVLSAVSGVAKGIQWLSNINMVLAVVLAAFLFVLGPTTNTNTARTTASTMLTLDSHWMPLAMPETAEATKAAVSSAMIATRTPFPTLPAQPRISRPLPICSAPRPSDAAEPNRVAKIARMSMTLPQPPLAWRPSSGSKAAEISCRRPLR